MAETVGFTGTRSGNPDAEKWVYAAVMTLPHGAVVVQGACIGVDALVAAHAKLRGLRVVSVLPADRRQVDRQAVGLSDEVEVMAEGTSFKDRDARVVARCDRMIAIADRPEEKSIRSGTWMTVRLARKAGKPVTIVTLRG